VDVILNPTFVLTEPLPFPNVKAGSTGTTGPITISSQDGFAGTISLSCVSTFGSGSCSISPASVSSFPTTATLTINGTSFSAGAYQVSVMGTSGALSHSLAIPFSVGDYTISGTQSLLTIPGSVAAANLSFASEDSYSGSVITTCDASALPGAQCTLSPVSPITVGGGSTVPVTASVTVPAGAAAGSFNLQINSHDSTGEPVHSWTVGLTVQDFAFGPVMPPAQSIGAGQSAVFNFSVTPVGAAFTNAVSLSCAALPANSTCSFAPSTLTPGSNATAVVLTIATSATSPLGVYSVVVTGVSGSLSHSTTLPLTLGSSFQLAIAQAFSSSADPGSQQTAKISLTPNYTGAVNAICDASTLPGTQCTISPSNPIAISGSPITVTVLVNIATDAAPGTYTINVDVQDAGPSGIPAHSVALPITVIQDFTLGTLTPATQTISAGQSASYNFSVLPVGASFGGAVTLSCSGGPTISLCSFTPNPITPGNSSAAVVMSISTTGASASTSRAPIFYALWLALPALACLGRRRRGKNRGKLTLLSSLFGLFLFGLLLTSCGGGGSNGGGGGGGGGGGQQQGTQPGTYTITVTGTAGTLTHQASAVTLIVN